MNYVAAIPTLFRYDLMERLLDQLETQTIPPQEVLVIDNGRNWTPSKPRPFPINRINPPYNYGVAKSWNIAGKLYRPSPLLICNDDVHFPKADAVERALSIISPIVWLHGASCFIMRESAWQAVGQFEEGLWPANCEDTEVVIRLRRAHIQGHDTHSIASNDRGTVGQCWAGTSEWCQRQIAFVESKWGSMDGIFTQPWNDSPITSLQWEYNQRCKIPSDMNEHMPVLRHYAEQCSIIAEFGVRSGNSSIALLAAQPQALLLYDIEDLRPESEILFHLRGRTRLWFRKQDSLKASLIAADMLHIDTDHTYQQLRAELFTHGNKIRKFIAMHDTETYGLHGDRGGEGLNRAIHDFVQDNPHWAIAEVRTNNNGMTILARK